MGEPPPPGVPNDARHRHVVDAFFAVGLPQVDPAVTVMWLSDPDTTAHAHGIGEPTSREALARVDAEVGHIQERLDAMGRLRDFNSGSPRTTAFRPTPAGSISRR